MRLFLLLCLFPFVLSAQFTDNFSDGDFTANPAWVGSTADFDVAGDSLHSNGPQASSVLYLSTPNSLIDSTEWNFLIRLEFNPSSTNYVRVFLVSDQQDLTGNLNGYYVQFGEAGTAPDSLDIFKKTGATSTKVFTGVSGIMSGTTTNKVRVRIVRHAGGNWDVYADKTGGSNFTSEGSFADNSITTTAHFGVVCTYSTASRYNLYYFDDFSIGNLVADVTKPTVSSVTVLSNTTIDVKFSEAVEVVSANNKNNYSVNNSIGIPLTAVRDAGDFSLVHLTFSGAFQNATNYLLTIANVKDLAGNTMNSFSSPFSFFTPQPYDVLINELMADPDPKVNLPALEFVELYNRTAFAINLNGWKFSDASTTVTIGNYTILPDSFIILCANANVDSFSVYGAVAGLSSLPSLNNTGDNLTLKDKFNNVIHQVNYVSAWYNSSVKNDGGWTLELINPQSPCSNTNNWTASNDLNGGTPGRRNSVYNVSSSSVLSLVGVNVVSSTQIELLFSENLNQNSANASSNYTVNNSVGNPSAAKIDSADFSKVLLTFPAALDSNLVYTVTANIQNCSGVAIGSSNSFQFAIPKVAEKFDVLINELLPDPDPVVGLPAAEYVELYNRSDKAINLLNWELSKAGASTPAKLPSYLLLPDSFVIITTSTNGILFAAYSNILAVSSFPSLTNTGDNILLRNASGSLIHYVPYTDDWYADVAKKDGGWSLELIDAENPCNGRENWRASVNPKGGTPGQRNSVVANNPDNTSPQLVRAALIDENSLLLYFSEPINNGSAAVASNYLISQGVGNPALALPIPYDYSTVQLEFLQNFSPGIIYSVRVSNLTDCNGNPVGLNDTARFAIADTAKEGDILINEILFNPKTAGYDFVELYNRSNKVIDLKQLDILEMNYDNPLQVLEQTAITTTSYLLFPQEYVVLSEQIDNIKQNYYCENPYALLQVPGLPNYDDNESICLLKVHNGETIDVLAYLNDWHFELIDDENGVSLERVNFTGPTQDKSSWHSAASTVGYATPTYLNSQFSETGVTEDAISVSPEVFTPDNDGDKDFTFIQYKFAEPGYSCNIILFDAKGREIKHLAKGELLNSSGQFQWDGTDNDGKKARIGIYIAFVEIFNLEGKVKRFKKELVLGGKLN